MENENVNKLKNKTMKELDDLIDEQALKTNKIIIDYVSIINKQNKVIEQLEAVINANNADTISLQISDNITISTQKFDDDKEHICIMHKESVIKLNELALPSRASLYKPLKVYIHQMYEYLEIQFSDALKEIKNSDQ